jgi:hypothetical protein
MKTNDNSFIVSFPSLFSLEKEKKIGEVLFDVVGSGPC